MWAFIARLWSCYSALWQVVAKVQAALNAARTAVLTQGITWGFGCLYRLALRLWV